jgi:hypothetical protein
MLTDFQQNTLDSEATSRQPRSYLDSRPVASAPFMRTVERAAGDGGSREGWAIRYGGGPDHIGIGLTTEMYDKMLLKTGREAFMIETGTAHRTAYNRTANRTAGVNHKRVLGRNCGVTATAVAQRRMISHRDAENTGALVLIPCAPCRTLTTHGLDSRGFSLLHVRNHNVRHLTYRSNDVVRFNSTSDLRVTLNDLTNSEMLLIR